MSLVEQTTILCILNEKHTQFVFSFFFLGLGNIKHVVSRQMYCKVGKYVLFTQQDRKRSLFAFFSLRNLVSTRIQIGNQKEVIDHSRPGLLFPLIHVVWVEYSITLAKLNVCINKLYGIILLFNKKKQQGILRCLPMPKSEKKTTEAVS